MSPSHGTRTSYQYGCRCDACRQAENAYRRERYAQRKDEPSGADDYDVQVTDALLFGVKSCVRCGTSLPDCSSYFRTYRGQTLGTCRGCYTRKSREIYRAGRAEA